jgi:GrpE
MSTVSREQIEQRIRELLEKEAITLDQLQMEDILPDETEAAVDLKSLYTALGSLQVEFRQMNRSEKKRLEVFKAFFDNEKQAKQQLLDRINTLVARSEESELRSLLLSLIEIRDFVETFRGGLAAAFAGKNPLFSWITGFPGSKAWDFVTDNVTKTVKKIDLSLERVGVFPIYSDNTRFDPTTMKAVETITDAARPDMIVIETVETGFLHNNHLLRPAKVIVNKIVME